jgi:hypothetical protein
MEIQPLDSLKFDTKNANKGKERGRKAVEHSIREYGAGRSILIDREGRIIAGNKTAENAAAAGVQEVIIVPTDGTRLVAVRRIDLDLQEDPKAVGLAIADNRAQQLSLEWDAAVLKEFSAELDLTPFFSTEELTALGAEPELTFTPASMTQQGKLDQKNKTECPSCGHLF